MENSSRSLPVSGGQGDVQHPEGPRSSQDGAGAFHLLLLISSVMNQEEHTVKVCKNELSDNCFSDPSSEQQHLVTATSKLVFPLSINLKLKMFCVSEMKQIVFCPESILPGLCSVFSGTC